ncbi:MAG: serine--tRNA ligase [Chloroflexi bacterium]|nr:serine--tRNA ligase [Chloroflexota bacterium]
MLSIQFIRQNPEAVRAAMEKRHDSAPLDEILALDEQHRKLLFEVESLRSQRKQGSKEYGRLKTGTADTTEGTTSEGATGELANIREQIKLAEAEVQPIEERLHDLLLRVPNIPDSSVPIGKDASDNIIVRSWGEPRQFDFPPLPHWDLGEALDIIDFQRGVKLSGTRFYVLKGPGARLQRALISFMLHLHISEHGYTEIYPPYMVKQECMIGSSNLPKFADNLYHDVEDDFWFIPTAEVPLTNLHRDEVLEAGTLPLYYVAYSACFRREKMAAGKDTRGIKRGHQFDKVELYKFTDPDHSMDELEKMVKNVEEVCRRLDLTYRVVQLCTGDLGFASAKSYDIELWAPGCQEWLEVSSCSNCTDFQARRANIRYRSEPGAKPQFLQTLNGSGLALPRVLISVLESYQQSDGSILVPDALLPYMDGLEVIK